MNYKVLNEMVKYIENHLDEEIDFDKLSKIAGMNIFILERIFNFLTGITLKEYIKKRRLSAAFEEIKNTNNKIIDIAFKYQFNSATSFYRAFKNQFGISPNDCRKKDVMYQSVPMIIFPLDDKDFNFDYVIKEFAQKKLYCYHLHEKNHDDLLYQIRKLFLNLRQEQDVDKLTEKEMLYGIFIRHNGEYDYYLGTTIKNENLEVYTLENTRYIVFKLAGSKQDDIVSLERKIKLSWYPSTKYNADKNITIENYSSNYTFIMLPLK